MKPPRWHAGMLVFGRTVVGTISRARAGSWNAAGCATGWEDTPLGSHASASDAKRRVEQWVEEKRKAASA